jgi:succinate dehydrogenase / fumarate reductase flavoprotein subunit
MYVAAWEELKTGEWKLNEEPLVYENIKIAQRSYK